MKKLTLKALLNNWLDTCVAGTVLPNTVRAYRCCVDCLLRHVMEDVLAMDFSRHDLQLALVEMKEEGLSKSTLTKTSQIVSRAYSDILDIQFGTVRIPRGAKSQKIDALTADEQREIETACLTVTNGFLFLFLLDTGLRGRELCRLKWEDYDGQGIYIKQSKTDKSERYIPLTIRAKEIIKTHGSVDSEYIFCSEIAGTPLTNDVLRRVYRNLRDKTGISHVSTRVCRHSFATRLFERNAHPKTVSELLGHTSVAFTMQRYTSISVEALEEGINLLNPNSERKE